MSVPLHESALFRKQLFRSPIEELNHRFTDFNEIDIKIQSENGVVHVTGMGNDFTVMNRFYLPITNDYSIALSMEGGQAIIYLLGMNTILNPSTTINMYNESLGG